MAFSNVHYVSIYQTVTSLTYVFVLLAFRPQDRQQRKGTDGKEKTSQRSPQGQTSGLTEEAPGRKGRLGQERTGAT